MENGKLDTALNAVAERLDELFESVEGIVESHWAAVRAMEQKTPGWENSSALQLRCHKKGNSLRIEWCGIKWYGSKAKGTRRSTRVYIKKPENSYGYTLEKLFAYCKEWEKPLVEDTEEKLTPIRREARHITKAMQLIRFAIASGSTKEDADA